MAKAILVGSALSAQLIPEYSYILDSINKEIPSLYEKCKQLFFQFKSLAFQENAIKELKNLGFSNPQDIYKTYFEIYGLRKYLDPNCVEIPMTETLLKIVSLFQLVGKTSEEDDRLIRDFSNSLYWNNGNNGLSAVQNDRFDVDKFKDFINGYDYVFTTNYDTILDDAFSRQVYHLHGSFLIDRFGQIRSPKQNEKDSCLIWGIDDKEKKRQVEATKKSHCYNIAKYNSGVKYNHGSVIEDYYNYLLKENFEQLDVFGYSGENDGHINQKIINNSHIKTINFYCSNESVKSTEFKQSTIEKFGNDKKINLVFWDSLWGKFMEGL